MHRVLILGAGKIGALISGLLASSGSYQVQLADVDGAVAEAVVRAHGAPGLSAHALNAKQRGALEQHLASHPVAAGVHYFDLTEDVEVTRAVRAIATGATRAFVPQCGLAPGFISIAAAELIK